jgi:hypothetical protein
MQKIPAMGLLQGSASPYPLEAAISAFLHGCCLAKGAAWNYIIKQI